MLARNRLRLATVWAINDDTAPYGPSCDCVGPIATNCDGEYIQATDSPSGNFVESLYDDKTADNSFPYIAVYTETSDYDFTSDTLGHSDTAITLSIVIYVTANSDWKAEADADELESRIMFRLMRPDDVMTPMGLQRPLISYKNVRANTQTDRDNSGDRRVVMREIRFTLTGCDEFTPPDCCTATSCAVVTTSADC